MTASINVVHGVRAQEITTIATLTLGLVLKVTGFTYFSERNQNKL